MQDGTARGLGELHNVSCLLPYQTPRRISPVSVSLRLRKCLLVTEPDAGDNEETSE